MRGAYGRRGQWGRRGRRGKEGEGDTDQVAQSIQRGATNNRCVYRRLHPD